MSDESAPPTVPDPGAAVPDALADLLADPPRGSVQRAWNLYVRGMEPEAIAAEVGAPAAVVLSWVGGWAVRGTEDGDPKRAVAGEALRSLLRKLWANIDAAAVSDKPKYASAIASIESKLVQLDGRCGARIGASGYCQEYPVRGGRRCFMHGGASPAGRLSARYEHGRYSRFPFPDEELAERAKEIRDTDPFEGMLDSIATATVVYHQAVSEGRSGVPELRALNDAITKYAEITKGKKVIHVPDEAAARALLGAIYGCVRAAAAEALPEAQATALLEGVARRVLAIDWAKLDIRTDAPIAMLVGPEPAAAATA